MRVASQGKSFLLGGSPFRFRGVRHQIAPESAGPGGDQARAVTLALDAVNAAGFTVVCLPPPPAWAVDRAHASGLRFMLELDDLDLNRIAGASWRERRRLLGDLETRVRRSIRIWDGSGALAGVVLRSRLPAERSAADAKLALGMANQIAIAVHDVDATLLAGRRAHWPHEGECPAEFDFLVTECRLAGWDAMAPALLACHGELADRPLVLGDVSVTDHEHAGTPDPAWVFDTSLRCGIAGTVEPRWSPAESGANARFRRRTVGDLELDWPSISIVINAYNAEGTLGECLEHCERLEYPGLEVIVVDDGSTDATARIAARHRARLLALPHGGLAAGRNAGYRAARGELVAYLDADAYPSAEWPWYLALAARGEGVGGSGGPNIPPSHEPVSARVVACSPGGPVPQLVGPDRAEYLPGCNIAFWRQTLEQIGGFDPVFDAAADDIELEWRLAESGHALAYHPAALVWHHRRPGLAPYLRQQRQYGRSQAILERRCPHRFPAGHRLRSAAQRVRARRGGEGRGASFTVRYLTLPGREDAILELAHQWGMPAAVVLIGTAPLGLLRRTLAVPGLAATAFAGTLFAIDVTLAGRGRRRSERNIGFRARVAAFRLLRPLAFRWGHLGGGRELRAGIAHWPPPPSSRSGPRSVRSSRSPAEAGPPRMPLAG